MLNPENLEAATSQERILGEERTEASESQENGQNNISNPKLDDTKKWLNLIVWFNYVTTCLITSIGISFSAMTITTTEYLNLISFYFFSISFILSLSLMVIS